MMALKTSQWGHIRMMMEELIEERSGSCYSMQMGRLKIIRKSAI